MNTSRKNRSKSPKSSNAPDQPLADNEATGYLVGRQPIFDRDLVVFGYELLYRSSVVNRANVVDGDEATLSVLMNTFSQAGFKPIVGDRKAFINLTRNFLLGRIPIPLPLSPTVLEILEDTILDEELIHGLGDLAVQGFQFALDDVTAVDRIARLEHLVQYVKIDIAAVDPKDLTGLVLAYKSKTVYLVAEKVETAEEYRACRALEFDYFQGYFFCKPEILSVRKLDTTRLVILQILSELQNPDLQFGDLNRIIAMDITLGYRLLKLINSGYYALPVAISSIQQAISLIGTNPLRNWLSIFLMASIKDKPRELCKIGLLRAKLAESLAKTLNLVNLDSYFMAGLFSILDALLDLPLQEVVAGMMLSDEIATGLLTHEGALGKILAGILEMEAGNWNLILGFNLSPEQINKIYLDAIQWTEKLSRELFFDQAQGLA